MTINRTGKKSRSEIRPGKKGRIIRLNDRTRQFFLKNILLISLCFSVFGLNGQNDSTETKKHSPKLAAAYSAVIPGLGQAYNRKYWKIPIVYAGMGTCAYFALYSNRRYNDFKTARNELNSVNPGGTIEFDGYLYTLNGLETGKEYYRRNRDLFTIFTAGVYILNIIDATVDAHLYDFDISDDLSLRVEPVPVHIISTGTINPGLSLKLTWR